MQSGKHTDLQSNVRLSASIYKREFILKAVEDVLTCKKRKSNV
jgi:hypothetical protein